MKYVRSPAVEFPDDDGGEVRAENFVAPDGTSQTLLTAYFYDAQTGKMELPRIGVGENGQLDCNWVGGTGGDGANPNPAPDTIYIPLAMPRMSWAPPQPLRREVVITSMWETLSPCKRRARTPLS